MFKYLFLVFLVLFNVNNTIAQTCTTPGQNASTAFPVCGTSTFSQTVVPLCGGRALPAVNCKNDGLTDINPFWYKFTCYTTGTLGFELTPLSANDDYDWEIYDITGKNATDVYTDGKLVISSNWSGEKGVTGASSAGTQGIVCGGFGKPLFSSMPLVQQGHNYLLLVSNFSRSQKGYTLAFKGGNGVITDAALPAFKKIEANCGGDVLRIGLSKKIRCSSITAPGTEFYITPAVTTISSASGINCNAQFDTDSLEVKLASFLPPGNYTLHVKKGSDNNTLLDNCDNSMSETDEIKFTILPKVPVPIDSIAPLECAPDKIKIVLARPVLCSSIAANGSDFSITGNYPVTITNVSTNCTSTREIILTLSKPLQQAGSFTLNLQTGSDGNTILDECGEQTPAGPKVNFSVKDTVSANFTYNIQYGCTVDVVKFAHDGG